MMFIARDNDNSRLVRLVSKLGLVVRVSFKVGVRNKRNQMHIFKGFDDQSDAYHNTQTNYLMEQEPSLTQDQDDGDGC